MEPKKVCEIPTVQLNISNNILHINTYLNILKYGPLIFQPEKSNCAGKYHLQAGECFSVENSYKN